MRIKVFSLIVLIVLFILFLVFLYPQQKDYIIREVISPCEFLLDNGEIFRIKDVETFHAEFSERNKILAAKFNLSEEDAFVMGNFGKYWAANILEDRKVRICDNNIIYYPIGYKSKLLHSPYSIVNEKFTNEQKALNLIKTIKSTKYRIFDFETETYYPISRDFIPNKYVIIKEKKKYYKKHNSQKKKNLGRKKSERKKRMKSQKKVCPMTWDIKDTKIIISDFTNKLKPNGRCSTDICKEIVNGINNAQKSIDIAIYGYSKVPAIERAIIDAKDRGVKIRLIYDLNQDGKNIYESTLRLANIIKNSENDGKSEYVNSIMHNKFLIIDEKIVITGSANLSRNDMSGFNSNSILVLNSTDVAQIYKQEFNQMYEGKFHLDKDILSERSDIYFSPQNKAIENGILPIIKNAKNYIYIPTFLLTEKRMSDELINAYKRGVDVKIIIDAVNAADKYSKVDVLRENKIPVKIENYAGKLHSKTIIADDKYLVIGSMNFSNSGEKRNDENLIILNNSDAAKFYRGFFLYLWEKIPDKWLRNYPQAEGFDSIGSCSDGVDNDFDGLIDSDDDGCKFPN